MSLKLLAVLLLLSSGLPSALRAGGVRYLSSGHLDVLLTYAPDTDTWGARIDARSTGVSFSPGEIVLKVPASAQTVVPAGPDFSFLGPAGSEVFIVPQVQTEGLPFLGWSGKAIPSFVIANDFIDLNLKSVSGPGQFAYYFLDGSGKPHVLVNSGDGINSADRIPVSAGFDSHSAWAFTKPGNYELVFQPSATLVREHKPTTGGLVTFHVSVGAPPVVLGRSHSDLALDFVPASKSWDLHVISTETQESHDASDAIFEVPASAKSDVPPDSHFAFLG